MCFGIHFWYTERSHFVARSVEGPLGLPCRGVEVCAPCCLKLNCFEVSWLKCLREYCELFEHDFEKLSIAWFWNLLPQCLLTDLIIFQCNGGRRNPRMCVLVVASSRLCLVTLGTLRLAVSTWAVMFNKFTDFETQFTEGQATGEARAIGPEVAFLHAFYL